MKIESRLFGDWPAEVRRQLMRLTLREESGMRDVITRYDGDNTRTWVATHGGKIVGWALLDRHGYGGSDAMFYVQRKYRRRGIGAALHKRVISYAHRFDKRNGHPEVYPHSNESLGFFKAMGEDVDDSHRFL